MQVMNRLVMVIWGLTITLMCTLIFVIGYKQQDKEYIQIVKNLKKASEIYVKSNGIKAKVSESVIIDLNDLIDGQYVEYNSKYDDYCINGVIYSKGIFNDSYKIREQCEDKENK